MDIPPSFVVHVIFGRLRESLSSSEIASTSKSFKGVLVLENPDTIEASKDLRLSLFALIFSHIQLVLAFGASMFWVPNASESYNKVLDMRVSPHVLFPPCRGYCFTEIEEDKDVKLFWGR